MARKRKKRKVNKKRLAILIAGVTALISGIALLWLIFTSIRDMPTMDPKTVMAIDLSTSIYDKDGNLATKLGPEYRIEVELSEIPKVMQDAVLAAEDHRFYDHFGIDFRSMGRAVWQDIRHLSKNEGASTITQQLVKNTFLSPEKKFKRKIQEAILALQVERYFSKEEILKMYLNRNYMGEGAYGVQAAAQTFFGKGIGDIEIHEAAMLAGLLQAPSALSPYHNSEGALDRRNIVLLNMKNYGYIDEEEYKHALEQPLGILEEPIMLGQKYPYPYFIDYVTEKLLAKYSEDMVFKGGLRVFTTLDPKIQSHTEATLANANNFPPSTTVDGIIQPQAAVVVIDHRNGHIRAIAGGREHTHKRQWNRATSTTRPPGSAFKPIAAYGPAVEFLGKGPASVVDDVPKSYPSHPQAYTPKNSDGSYKGLITYREAVRRSVNVAAVEVLSRVGVKDSLNFATKLGISTFHSTDQGLGIALGGLHTGVTPLELAGAYGAFANNGTYVEPIVITKIESKEGEVLENIVPQDRKVMKETTAYLVTDMLKSVIQGGTGTSANIGRPAAGKTGTSDDNKDLWFAGYTTDLTCVVWVGYDEPKRIPNAFGGTYAAPIWATIMRQAHVGLPVRDFTQPEGIVVATVDSKSGLKPGPLTPEEHLVTDKFARGTVPSDVDNTHVLVEVCAISGKLPTPNCRERITKVMLDLPYSVPENVADFDLRVPVEYCDVHLGPQTPGEGENGNGSGGPNGNGQGNGNGSNNDNDGGSGDSGGNGGDNDGGDIGGGGNGTNGDNNGIEPDHWWRQ